MKHTIHKLIHHRGNLVEADRCPACNGGLALCEVCHGAEGCLATDCPGRRMLETEKTRVTAGDLDFVGSRWVPSQRRYDVV